MYAIPALACLSYRRSLSGLHVNALCSMRLLPLLAPAGEGLPEEGKFLRPTRPTSQGCLSVYLRRTSNSASQY